MIALNRIQIALDNFVIVSIMVLLNMTRFGKKVP